MQSTTVLRQAKTIMLAWTLVNQTIADAEALDVISVIADVVTLVSLVSALKGTECLSVFQRIIKLV
jgi:hypothetical protein